MERPTSTEEDAWKWPIQLEVHREAPSEAENTVSRVGSKPTTYELKVRLDRFRPCSLLCPGVR